MKYCSHCGEQLNDDVNYCPKCGLNVNQNNNFSKNSMSNVYDSSKSYDESSESTFIYSVIGFFVPIVGIILFCIWNNEYPSRAKSAIKGTLIAIAVYVILFVLLFIFSGSIIWKFF